MKERLEMKAGEPKQITFLAKSEEEISDTKKPRRSVAVIEAALLIRTLFEVSSLKTNH